MGIFGAAKRGFGMLGKKVKSAQRARRIAKGERGKTTPLVCDENS